MSFQINEALKCMIFSRLPKAPAGPQKPLRAPEGFRGPTPGVSAPFSDPGREAVGNNQDARSSVAGNSQNARPKVSAAGNQSGSEAEGERCRQSIRTRGRASQAINRHAKPSAASNFVKS